MRNIQRNKRLRKESGNFELYNNILTSSPSSSGFHDTNIGNLKVVIDYFTSMRNNGKINDKQFSALITNLCADFIANEMLKTFKEILGEYIYQ
jgi:hypothetical protein